MKIDIKERETILDSAVRALEERGKCDLIEITLDEYIQLRKETGLEDFLDGNKGKVVSMQINGCRVKVI